MNLAALYLKDKELDKALSCILISLSLDPNNSNVKILFFSFLFLLFRHFIT